MKTHSVKAPSLKPIDLSKCYAVEGAGTFYHGHPDITSKARYLALIGGSWFAGGFSRQWYGWSFDGWGGGGGLQLDKPGTNASSWQALFEIVK